MWRRTIETLARTVAQSDEPWYRRPDVWLMLGAILLPFGWVLALGRLAWSQAASRRERKQPRGDAPAPLAGSGQDRAA